jgi:hypothetical protein
MCVDLVESLLDPIVPPTRIDKSRQEQTRADKSRQEQTRADKSRQERTRADKSRQEQTVDLVESLLDHIVPPRGVTVAPTPTVTIMGLVSNGYSV